MRQFVLKLPEAKDFICIKILCSQLQFLRGIGQELVRKYALSKSEEILSYRKTLIFLITLQLQFRKNHFTKGRLVFSDQQHNFDAEVPLKYNAIITQVLLKTLFEYRDLAYKS